MCGIAALIGLPGVNVAPHIQVMTHTIRHRGPDDEGYVLIEGRAGNSVFLGGQDTSVGCYSSGLLYTPCDMLAEGGLPTAQLALGHRRLSILDLSPAGHQPMADDARHLIVYNGEVYNHVELRAELESLGHTFRSKSDTEVVLAAWRQWGNSCVERFNGMFAFVIVDLDGWRLFAARDRFGVKPLYWWLSPVGMLAIGSEIKQFSVLPGWQPRLNGQRAYDFLNWAVSDHTTETLFEGVHQLSGGEYVDCSIDEAGRGLKPRRWYRLCAAPVAHSLSEAVEQFRTLFDDSVRLRLRADVEVGTGLSGGLDSSSIVCTVNSLLRAQHAHALQNTFSACTKDLRYDERPFIDEIVRQTGVTAHTTFPELDSLFPSMQQIIWHQDEPFYSTSIYAEWNVFKLVSQTGVKVTLDGHGADELLAGYHGFFGARLAGLLLRGHWLGFVRETNAMRKRFGYGYVLLVMRVLDTLLPDFLRQPLRRMSGRASLDPSWLDTARLGVEPSDPFRHSGAKARNISDMSVAQLLYTSLPVQLHWADRDSMAHSVESRVPFLDYRLVEFIVGCPDEFKIEHGVTKRVLRDAMRDRLPIAVADRVDKMGFVTPEASWVRECEPEYFRLAVRQAVEKSHGVLTDVVNEQAEKIIAGRGEYNSILWRWICFGDWMERFGVEA